MKTFLENKDITLDLTFVDGDGAPFEATAASYRLVDVSGNELIALTAIPGFVAGASASLMIPANKNLVPATDFNVPAQDSGQPWVPTATVQTVELTLTNAGGTIIQHESYALEKVDILVVPINSFLTVTQAEATALVVMNKDGWDAANRNDKVRALIEARNRLVKLRYRSKMIDPTQTIVDPTFAVHDFNLLTLSEFTALPQEFRVALQRAQVAEANDLLSGGSVSEETRKHREDGLMSMTVGESSQMFRPGKPLKLPVCREAIGYIEKFLSWHKRTTRT